MRVSHIAAECSPLAQVGGLGDVVGALTEGLARRGHEVELFLPLYPFIDRQSLEFEASGPAQTIQVGRRRFDYVLRSASRSGSKVRLRLVDAPDLFDLPSVYRGDADEPWRYVFLTAVALRALEAGKQPASIVHCHDWHTALLPAWLRSGESVSGNRRRPRTVLTLHNLAHQGVFGREIAVEIGVAELNGVDLEDGWLNFLQTGICTADLLTTVSPTYAREIQTPELGMGLEESLRQRHDRLVGVINGVEAEVWDPARDSLIPARYSVDDLAGKLVNRRELMSRAGLTAADRTPILGIVSRLVEQKGFELFRDGFDRLLEEIDAILVVLGTGDPAYEDLFVELRRRCPGRVALFREFNVGLAHLVEAGSDIFLMPSRFEPCGLNQMYSMLYGTVPIVHRTGGLADTVRTFDEATGEGTGWVFDDYTVESFHAAVRAAIDRFRRPDVWQRVMENGMRQDLSWEVSVGRYEYLYRQLTADGSSP